MGKDSETEEKLRIKGKENGVMGMEGQHRVRGQTRELVSGAGKGEERVGNAEKEERTLIECFAQCLTKAKLLFGEEQTRHEPRAREAADGPGVRLHSCRGENQQQGFGNSKYTRGEMGWRLQNLATETDIEGTDNGGTGVPAGAEDLGHGQFWGSCW